MMKSWIEQPGFPLITVKRQGRQLVITQKRFTYLQNDSDQKWQVPMTIRLFPQTGSARQVTTVLGDNEQLLYLDEDIVAYKLNDRQTGFYRVKYDDSINLNKLGSRVLEKSLSPEDRWGLENDFFALVKSGDASLEDYLKFIYFYRREEAYLPLTGMAGNLYSVYLLMGDEWRQKISSIAKPWFESILEKIGYEPVPHEKHTTALLRDQIIWDATLYGSTTALNFASGQFHDLMQGGSVHADIMKSVMRVGALSAGSVSFDWLDQQLQKSKIEHERLNILSALGCFKDEALIKKCQQYTLESVPARNKFIPVVAMASNPYAIPLLWDWYVDNLMEFEQFHPMLYERVIAAIVPTAGIKRSEEVKAFFADYLKKTDKAMDVIKLSLERLDINLRMRNSG
jgi:tricorn protease interacting factor F2/3